MKEKINCYMLSCGAIVRVNPDNISYIDSIVTAMKGFVATSSSSYTMEKENISFKEADIVLRWEETSVYLPLTEPVFRD